MTLPGNTNIEKQGGIVSLSAPSKLVLVMGTASQGPLNEPTRGDNPGSFVSTFGFGHGVNGAGISAQAGRATSFMRLDSDPGSVSAVTKTGSAGTSVVTVDASGDEPFSDFDIQVKVTKSGTVSTYGAQIQYTINGGLDWSATYTLGTANFFVIPNTGVRLDFAAGSLGAGDVYKVTATGPVYDDQAITDAFAALQLSGVRPDVIVLAGAADATTASHFYTQIAGLKAKGVHVWGLTEMRVNNADQTVETYAAYKTAMLSALSSVVSSLGAMGAWAVRITSPIWGVQFRMSQLWSALGVLVPDSISENPASIGGHACIGTLRDEKGFLVEHDEFFDEGLSDRFITLRSWPNQPGIYVTRAQLLSAPADSIQLTLHRRIVNEAERTADQVSAVLAHNPLKADEEGFISKLAAKYVEATFQTALDGSVAPHCSKVIYTVDRTFPFLTSKKIKGRLKIQPFGYPEFFETEIYLTAAVQ